MKIRASQIGKIMTNARNKSEPLSETTKFYLKELYLEKTFGVSKFISSKYIEKGNFCENESIVLASEVLDLGFTEKNETNFSNDFITGTPDVIGENYILDVKTTWDYFTHPFFESNPNKDYFYQLQGYMWLCDKPKAYLCHCLVNTPKFLLSNWDDMALHNFDKLEKEKRVKTYVIERDGSIIESIKEKVILCNEFFKTLEL